MFRRLDFHQTRWMGDAKFLMQKLKKGCFVQWLKQRYTYKSPTFFLGGAGESTDLSVIFTLGGSNFVLFYPKVLIISG